MDWGNVASETAAAPPFATFAARSPVSLCRLLLEVVAKETPGARLRRIRIDLRILEHATPFADGDALARMFGLLLADQVERAPADACVKVSLDRTDQVARVTMRVVHSTPRGGVADVTPPGSGAASPRVAAARVIVEAHHGVLEIDGLDDQTRVELPLGTAGLILRTHQVSVRPPKGF